MKEHKYEYTAKKLISYYATVYDFSPGKTLFEKVLTGVIWSGAFITLVALAVGFFWLFGGCHGPTFGKCLHSYSGWDNPGHFLLKHNRFAFPASAQTISLHHYKGP